MNYKANLNLLALRDSVICSMPGPDGKYTNGIFIPAEKNDAYIGFKSEKQPDGTWKRLVDTDGRFIPNRFSVSVNIWEHPEAYREACSKNPENMKDEKYIAPSHKIILSLRKEHRENLMNKIRSWVSQLPSFLNEHPNATNEEVDIAARNAYEKRFKLADVIPTTKANLYQAPVATFGQFQPVTDGVQPSADSHQSSGDFSNPAMETFNRLFDLTPTPQDQPPVDLSSTEPEDDLPF